MINMIKLWLIHKNLLEWFSIAVSNSCEGFESFTPNTFLLQINSLNILKLKELFIALL